MDRDFKILTLAMVLVCLSLAASIAAHYELLLSTPLCFDVMERP